MHLPKKKCYWSTKAQRLAQIAFQREKKKSQIKVQVSPSKVGCPSFISLNMYERW